MPSLLRIPWISRGWTPALNEPDYYDGVFRHPEPDILECKVRWALRCSAVNKASGCDEIPAELFRKDDAIRFAFIMPENGRHRSDHRTGKGQFSSQFPRRVVPKNVLTIRQLHSTPMLVRSCLKSCMLGFSII